MNIEPLTMPEQITLAGCVIFDENQKFYLLHRNTPKRVQWELPGGKIDEGEDANNAAIRELDEELGVTVKISKKLGEKIFYEDEYTMHYTWFLGEIVQGQPQIIEVEKFDDLKTFSWEELKDKHNELSENTKNLVTSYFANELNL